MKLHMKQRTVTYHYFLLIILSMCFFVPQNSFAQASSNMAVKEINLSALDWKLWGYRIDSWRKNFDFQKLQGDRAEIMNIPVHIPGSVQKALKDASLISDWNIGTNSIESEWVENRHWLFTTTLPDNFLANGNQFVLHCDGLDQKGLVYVNGKEAGSFNNAFIPYNFDLTPFLKDKNNTLAIIFECSPSYLGHSCWTSKIKDWKPRFYYGWDWTPRIVQIGIWDNVNLQISKKDDVRINNLLVTTNADKLKDLGELRIKASLSGLKDNNIHLSLIDPTGRPVLEETLSASELSGLKTWNNLKIKRWWPNGHGNQPLYRLSIDLLDTNGNSLQKIDKEVGFKHVEWLPCKNAPTNADPWICSINNKPIFLQGINWTPILPNFADVNKDQYIKLLTTYKNLGINTIRIWGGGFPEKDWLYELCDQLGILIWQDFPISSSGLDNYPPTDPVVINEMTHIVKQYLDRLQHHVSILIWCAGNELYELENNVVPVTDKHPMIKAMKEWVNLQDPQRRFLSGTPSGPNKTGNWQNFGKGINWDVHGPWNLPFASDDSTMVSVDRFWKTDDALFHSEVGVPGAMSAEMINKYKGKYDALPANTANPLWRNVNWWIEWNDYLKYRKNQPANSLNDYVAWSQKRQTEGLCIALKNCKNRFPACGGFIIWMGHDSFPCPVNTSIIDFDGNLKPVAYELEKIFKTN
jgi:Beta-galactosidase/beta-glucuronidase